MPKYKINVDDGRYDKEYTSIVAARKAAMDYIRKSGRYWCNIYQYSQKHSGKWWNIGNVEWPGDSYHPIYEQNHMGMPRPNDIKDGQWVLDKNGRIVSTVSAFNRSRQRMWQKRYKS